MIIGSGSASFEILRYLADRLPVMITPKWVRTPTQPIAVNNVLDYLIGCLHNEAALGRTFDIGGPEVLNYKDLIRIYSQEAGLRKRWILPVPLLTPRLSAHWIHLVTPVPAEIALPLTEGLGVPTTCADTAIRNVVDLELTSCRQAIRAALGPNSRETGRNVLVRRRYYPSPGMGFMRRRKLRRRNNSQLRLPYQSGSTGSSGLADSCSYRWREGLLLWEWAMALARHIGSLDRRCGAAQGQTQP